MCSEAYRFGRKNTADASIKHEPAQRPREESPPLATTVCNKCFQKIGRGIRHSCTKKNLLDNLMANLQKRCIVEKVAGCSVSSRLSQNESEIMLPRPGGGHPIQISATNSPSSQDLDTNIKRSRLSLGDLVNLKRVGSLSNTGTASVLSVLKKAGIKSVRMDQYYDARRDLVGQYFESVSVDLHRSAKKKQASLSKACVVRCTRVDQLLKSWLGSTGESDLEKPRYKLGLDHGQKFLKLTVEPFGSNSVN